MGKAFELGYKVGDTVKFNDSLYKVDDEGYGVKIEGPNAQVILFNAPPYNYRLVFTKKDFEGDSKPSGGPSAYYDFPFHEWTTVNDMIDYLARKSWLHDSWIFKDIMKACTRWGAKQGTTKVYDAKKIIYYGLRLLMSVSDKKTVQEYLKELMNDKQFQ